MYILIGLHDIGGKSEEYYTGWIEINVSGTHCGRCMHVSGVGKSFSWMKEGDLVG